VPTHTQRTENNNFSWADAQRERERETSEEGERMVKREVNSAAF